MLLLGVVLVVTEVFFVVVDFRVITLATVSISTIAGIDPHPELGRVQVRRVLH